MSLPFERSHYENPPLDEDSLDASPFEQLRKWISDAIAADAVEPSAMCLSTVSEGGRPSSRMVLLRGLDDRGLVFYTNYNSRKGRELQTNTQACVCFWWTAGFRQVRVEGRIEKATEEESDAYFYSRPRHNQLASAASPQSEVVEDFDALSHRLDALAEAHPDRIPRPEHWGGYRLVPDRFEFWQGRPARLHDRLVYAKTNNSWKVQRLAP